MSRANIQTKKAGVYLDITFEFIFHLSPHCSVYMAKADPDSRMPLKRAKTLGNKARNFRCKIGLWS